MTNTNTLENTTKVPVGHFAYCKQSDLPNMKPHLETGKMVVNHSKWILNHDLKIIGEIVYIKQGHRIVRLPGVEDVYCVGDINISYNVVFNATGLKSMMQNRWKNNQNYQKRSHDPKLYVKSTTGTGYEMQPEMIALTMGDHRFTDCNPATDNFLDKHWSSRRPPMNSINSRELFSSGADATGDYSLDFSR